MTTGGKASTSPPAGLARALAGRRRVALCALGSRRAGDDGVGPALLEKCRLLRPAPGREVFCLDAGTWPEVYLGRIERWRPEAIVFLDAVAGGRPGRLWFFDLAEGEPGVSLGTHGLPLSAVAAFFRAALGADCFLLGVGGERFYPARSLSPGARRGIRRAFAALSRALAGNTPGRGQAARVTPPGACPGADVREPPG